MTIPKSIQSDDAVRYPSLESLRAAHTELLKAFRKEGNTAEIIANIELFIRRGRATGALLDADADRWTAQTELDYWSTQLYQPGYEPPDATLDEFDPQLAPELDDSLCPYMGLDAFREGNESVFFGRERLVHEIIDELKATRFLPVLGSSGSGKSSLIRAGVVPELKKGALAGSAEWYYFPPMVPGSNPLQNLARLVAPTGSNATQLDFEAGAFREDPEHLVQAISEGTGKSVVLVIDQFEEIFTLCTDEVARNRFVENLIALCQVPEAEHRMIITMRTDFETNITRVPSLQAIFEQHAVHITPLTASELRQSIEAPAALIGLKFEQGVVDALLNDILGEPAALPLLQFTLLKLWENRERNRVTWETYRKLGGGRQALSRSADEFYNSLIPEEQVTMRRTLLKMVRPGEGLEVTSNRVERKVLYKKGEASDRIDRVLDKLIQERLVRISEGDTDMEDQVEIAHEALVRNWPRLVEWLEEERVALRQRQRLTTAAEEWQRLNGATAALWRRELLDEALRYDDLNELERKFVKASKTRQQRSRRFWAYGITLTIFSLILVATVLGVQANNNANLAATAQAASTQAFEQKELAEKNAEIADRNAEDAKQQATIALANSLATKAQSIIERRGSNQLTGVLLAIHALNNSPTLEEAKTLLQDFSFSSEVTRITHNDSVNAIAVSPDGKYIASASNDYTVQVRELKTGNLISSMSHYDLVNTVAFSPDSKYVISGSYDWAVNVWDAQTGELISGLFHENSVNAVTISLDGKYVGSGSSDGTARVWELETGEEFAQNQYGSNGIAKTVAFSPDGKYFASGGCDLFDEEGYCMQGAVHVMVVATGTEIFVGEHDTQVNTLAFSPDSKYLVTGSDDHTARIWQIETRQEIVRKTHDNRVNAVAFSPDGRAVVSGSSDGTAQVWEAATGFMISSLAHEDDVYAVAFSPDGKYVITGGYDRTARVWEIPRGIEVARMTHDDWVNAVAFSPDGRYWISGSADRTVRVWEILEKKDVVRFTHNASVSVVAFSPNGKYGISGSSDGVALLWETETGKERGRLTHNDSISVVKFSGDGRYVVTGSYDGSVQVLDIETGKKFTPINHNTPVYAIGFSQGGKYLLSASADKIVKEWEIGTTKEVINEKRLDSNSSVNVVAFSSDGKYVVFGNDDGTVQVLELASGRVVPPMSHGLSVYAVTFSLDGKYVISGSADNTARIWERATGREVARMTHNDWVLAVAVHPNGQYVVSGSYDGTVRVWEIITGKEIGTLYHDSYVISITFSLNGKYVVSGSADGTVRVLDVETGNNDRIPRNSSFTSVAVSPDGKYIVSGSDDGTVRVSVWQIKELIQYACNSVPRNLTLEEWNQFFDEDTEYEKTCPDLPVHPTVVKKAVEDALSLSTDPDRIQNAIDKADDLIDGGSEEARDFVKEVIQQQIAALSLQILDDQTLEQYFNLLDDAKQLGLEIMVEQRILDEIARKALQDQNDPNRVNTAITKTNDVLNRYLSSVNSDVRAREIVRESIGILIDESDWETEDLTYNFALLNDAKGLGVEITNAYKLNYICWHGSIRDYAREVLPYCEQAIKLAPDDPGYRDSRGLARARTKDFTGAIEDFQYFVDYGGYYDPEWIKQRQEWIVELRQGKDPFTPEVLEIIKYQ
jgi:WD40 repeat protein